MMIEINIQNGISKYLQSLISNSPDFVRGCSKSMGYFVQREIISELRKGGSDFKAGWPIVYHGKFVMIYVPVLRENGMGG